jgi:hypothetical protein
LEYGLEVLKGLIRFSGDHPMITAAFWFILMGLYNNGFKLFEGVVKNDNYKAES